MKRSIISGWAAALLLSGGAADARGVRQSPIDIEERAVVTAANPALIVARLAPAVTLDLYNTHDPSGAIDREWATLKANVPAGSSIELDGAAYQLLQFHFHTPAEHAVNRVRSPMEMHFVFKRDQAPACGRGPDALLVIGVRIEAGAAHAELGKIFDRDDLPSDMSAPRLAIEGFDLGKVLGPLDASWRYSGSLTAPASFEPSCREQEGSIAEQLSSDTLPENVSWVVLPRSITMSPKQIDSFRALFREGNARKLQPIEGRSVTAY